MKKHLLRVALLTLLVGATAGLQASTWNGTSGLWSDPTKWSGGIPLGGGNALFPTGGFVYDDLSSFSLNSLTAGFLDTTITIGQTNHLGIGSMGAGTGVFTLQNGAGLSIGDPTAFTGNISLGSTGSLTTVSFGTSTFNGQIQLGASASNTISGITGFETFTNTGGISAKGGVISNMASFINSGAIETPTLGMLTIGTSEFNNQGTLFVDANSIMRITSPHFDNYNAGVLGGGTLDVSGTLVVGGANISTIDPLTVVQLSGSGIISNGSGNALTNISQNSGGLILGGGQSLTLQSAVLQNTGGISIAGATLNMGRLVNTGTITVEGTGTTEILGHGLSNTGSLALNSGGAVFTGGGFDSFLNLDAATETLSGGSIELGVGGRLQYDAGTGIHGGEILHLASDTSLSLSAAGQLQYGVPAKDALAQLNSNAGTLTLLGGAHTFAPVDGTFVNSGILNVLIGGTGANVIGDFINTAAGSVTGHGGSLSVTGTLTNHGGMSFIDTGGPAALSAGLGIINDGGITMAGNMTSYDALNRGVLTIQSGSGTAASVTVTSVFENQAGNVTVGTAGGVNQDTLNGSLILNDGGTMNVQTLGKVTAGTYEQTSGSTTMEGGSIVATNVDVWGGHVDGYGTIAGFVDQTAGDIQVDGGLMEITGDYLMTGGTLTEAIDSNNWLHVDGNVTLGGTFEGLLNLPAVFALGQRYEILQFQGTISGDFSAFAMPTLPAGLQFVEMRDTNSVILEVDAAPTATPEPSYTLLGGGILLGLATWGRRRRK